MDRAHVGTVDNENAHVGALAKLGAAIVRAQTKEALIDPGWEPAGRSRLSFFRGLLISLDAVLKTHARGVAIDLEIVAEKRWRAMCR